MSNKEIPLFILSPYQEHCKLNKHFSISLPWKKAAVLLVLFNASINSSKLIDLELTMHENIKSVRALNEITCQTAIKYRESFVLHT